MFRMLCSREHIRRRIRIHVRFIGIYWSTMILQNYYYEILSVNDYQKVAVSLVDFAKKLHGKNKR